MSIGTDRIFIAKIASRLKNFKWKNNNIAQFSCPYCGDSKRIAHKTRGYLYRKANDMFFRCHNCGYGTTFSNFLKDLDSNAYSEYVLERYAHGEGGSSNFKAPDFSIFKTNSIHLEQRNKMQAASTLLTPISKLQETHPAYVYCKDERKIDKLNRVSYVDNFYEFIKDVAPEMVQPTNGHPSAFCKHTEPRIVFICKNTFGEHIGYICRDYMNITNKRYIMIKLINHKDEPFIYGTEYLNTMEHVYVVEGPIDSLFLPNCLAVSGSDLEKVSTLNIPKPNITLLYDNEPRSPIIIKKMMTAIKHGYKIVVFPSTFLYKDLNAAIMDKVNPTELIELIKSRTFSGISASAEISFWKKV